MPLSFEAVPLFFFLRPLEDPSSYPWGALALAPPLRVPVTFNVPGTLRSKGMPLGFSGWTPFLAAIFLAISRPDSV